MSWACAGMKSRSAIATPVVRRTQAASLRDFKSFRVCSKDWPFPARDRLLRLCRGRRAALGGGDHDTRRAYGRFRLRELAAASDGERGFEPLRHLGEALVRRPESAARQWQRGVPGREAVAAPDPDLAVARRSPGVLGRGPAEFMGEACQRVGGAHGAHRRHRRDGWGDRTRRVGSSCLRRLRAASRSARAASSAAPGAGSATAWDRAGLGARCEQAARHGSRRPCRARCWFRPPRRSVRRSSADARRCRGG